MTELPNPNPSAAPTTPSAPTDPLPAKLLELLVVFELADVAEVPIGPGMQLLRAQIALVGVPIEEMAVRVRDWYADQVRHDARRTLETESHFDPAEWILVCPPYLFWNMTELCGMKIQHSGLCPDWTVMRVRSPQYWSGLFQAASPLFETNSPDAYRPNPKEGTT